VAIFKISAGFEPCGFAVNVSCVGVEGSLGACFAHIISRYVESSGVFMECTNDFMLMYKKIYDTNHVVFKAFLTVPSQAIAALLLLDGPIKSSS
jgi:hypothetical protein